MARQMLTIGNHNLGRGVILGLCMAVVAGIGIRQEKNILPGVILSVLHRLPKVCPSESGSVNECRAHKSEILAMAKVLKSSWNID